MPRTCVEDGCAKKSIAQGLCRQHYDAKRDAGALTLVAGKPYTSGRPPGKVKSSALPEGWKNRPAPTRQECEELAMKRLCAILEDDAANQQEVLACIKIAFPTEVTKKGRSIEEIRSRYLKDA
jgi:hypothetical protein